jgi:AcrR family transcriptional regulator
MLRVTDTEKLICDKLIEMMRMTPFYRIKVSHLVENAQIARSTFYLYFDSIFAVVQKIEDDFIDGMLVADIEGSRTFNEAAVCDAISANIAHLKTNIDVVRALMGDNGDPAFQARLINRSRRLMKERFPSLSDFSDIEKRLTFEYFIAGQWSMVKWWVFNEDVISEKDFCLLVGKLICQMFNNLL